MKEQEWYHDRMYEMRRELAQEQERLTDKAKQLEERMQLMDAMDGLLAENSKQQADIEALQQQLAEDGISAMIFLVGTGEEVSYEA